MATFHELVKQSLMEGLKRVNYDIKRFQPASIKAGLFADRSEIENAERTTWSIVKTINTRAEKGEKMSRENLETIIDIESADRAFEYELLRIKIYMRSGKNVSKYVQEARTALMVLEKYPEVYISLYKRRLNETIGEE